MQQSMTIAGQRINVAPFSDYLLAYIQDVFETGTLVLKLAKHSAVIQMAVELVAPTLPRRLYKKVGDTYYWQGTNDELGEFLGGLWLVYWKYELEHAQDAKHPERIATAMEQIRLAEEELNATEPDLQKTEPDLQKTELDLQQELEDLKAKVAETI
jgi:hypothetical protein